MFEFKILARDKRARVGELITPHGKLTTPELAFVATEAQLKSIPKELLSHLPVRYCIVNTFHTLVKNIIPEIEKASGVHTYMDYHYVAASDSGGFQVFSLGFGKAHKVGKIAPIFPGESKDQKGLLILRDHGNLLNITQEGVMFNYDKKWLLLTPEMSIQAQERIGADIMFAFDECTSPLNSHTYTSEAMERTHSWLKRCMKVWKSSNLRAQQQALFGVVQGGFFEDLRKTSAQFVGKQDVPGFGIGGTLGRSKEDMHSVIEWTVEKLPDEKPRHLLGIGQVRDIFEAVERGVDMFDCVIPTREARHKVLYTNHGRVTIRKFRSLDEVVDKACKCQSCEANVTLKQLNELFTKKDPRAYQFATIHNIQFFADLMKKIRESIEFKKLKDLKSEYFRNY